jgi:hypothetical protein
VENIYINKDEAVRILAAMQSFESDLRSVYCKWDYNFRDNLGRRNALVSMAQEVETAKILSERYKGVTSDGGAGKPDICIEEIDAEIECKLTSGSRSGNSVTYDFRTDWETLCKKGSLDYVYIVASEDFDAFCFLYFKGLTPDDFFPPASGSRGKSRMNKAVAMKKCVPLTGGFEDKSIAYTEKLQEEIKQAFQEGRKRDSELQTRLAVEATTVKKWENIDRMINNNNTRTAKKLEKLNKKLEYWQTAPPRFKFNLEKVK